jgi:hypothetical protein
MQQHQKEADRLATQHRLRQGILRKRGPYSSRRHSEAVAGGQRTRAQRTLLGRPALAMMGTEREAAGQYGPIPETLHQEEAGYLVTRAMRCARKSGVIAYSITGHGAYTWWQRPSEPVPSVTARLLVRRGLVWRRAQPCSTLDRPRLGFLGGTSDDMVKERWRPLSAFSDWRGLIGRGLGARGKECNGDVGQPQSAPGGAAATCETCEEAVGSSM